MQTIKNDLARSINELSKTLTEKKALQNELDDFKRRGITGKENIKRLCHMSMLICREQNLKNHIERLRGRL